MTESEILLADRLYAQAIEAVKSLFNNLYPSPNIIRMIKSRRMRWEGHVARMGEKGNACRIFVGKPEGKRPLGKPRRSWVDNTEMDLRGIGWFRIGTSGGFL
jgi:hypothetical protein